MNAMQTDVHYHKEIICLFFLTTEYTHFSNSLKEKKSNLFQKRHFITFEVFKIEKKKSYQLSKSLQLCYTCIWLFRFNFYNLPHFFGMILILGIVLVFLNHIYWYCFQLRCKLWLKREHNNNVGTHLIISLIGMCRIRSSSVWMSTVVPVSARPRATLAVWIRFKPSRRKRGWGLSLTMNTMSAAKSRTENAGCRNDYMQPEALCL